jgi:hypothetical protein
MQRREEIEPELGSLGMRYAPERPATGRNPMFSDSIAASVLT